METVIVIVIILALLGLLKPLLRLVGELFGMAWDAAREPEEPEPEPTERQIAYIALLLNEREVPPELLVDVDTRAEASALIDALKECPRR